MQDEHVGPTLNLRILIEACKRTLELNDFWILAALTDRSYEVGCKNPAFANEIEPYYRIGLPSSLLAQLHEGINGNLARFLKCEQNKGGGQDVTFGGVDTPPARLESKLAFECTYQKYYRTIAEDWTKLANLRNSPCNDDLFLVVFFVQLPSYSYPAGETHGKKYPSRPRRNAGILDQFELAKSEIGFEPSWPAEQPFIHNLTSPESEILRVVAKWCELSTSDSEWKFDSILHLKGAAAGVSIWQIA